MYVISYILTFCCKGKEKEKEEKKKKNLKKIWGEGEKERIHEFDSILNLSDWYPSTNWTWV